MAQVQEQELRAQAFDTAIKQTAAITYKFKQAVTEESTAAWQNTFYRETTTSALTAQSGNAIRALPRLANPPTNSVDWEQIDKYQEKYMFEDVISWEDILTNSINVQGRTLFRIAEAITKGVDDAIYSALTDTTTNTTINTVNIATTLYWDGTSAAIIDNLMNARQLIVEDGYSPENLMVFLSPKDHRSVMNYLAGKGAQFPLIGEQIATNGKVGRVAGFQLIEAVNVTASQALIVVPRLCATWKQAAPLQTNTTENPFISVRIRAVEIGACHVTDPKAICFVKGTQGPF